MKTSTKYYSLIAVIGLLLVSALIGFGTMSKSKAASDDMDLVESFSIARNGKELSGNTIVYKADILDIQYRLVELITQGESANIESGRTYRLSLPNNLVIASKSEWDVRTRTGMEDPDIPESELPILCHCTYISASNKIEVVFAEDIFDASSDESIQSAIIGFYATVDGSNLNVGDPITLNPPMGSVDDIIGFYGGEKKPENVTVKKTGAAFNENTNTIDWTITLTEGPNGETAFTVVDTMEDKLQLVPGTFMVDGNAATPTIAGTQLTYELVVDAPIPNKEHVITYSTAVFPIGKSEKGDTVLSGMPLKFDVTNKVSVYADGTEDPLGSSEATVNCDFDNIRWMEKNYKEIKKDPRDPDSRILTWEVKVHASKYTFENVVLYDEIEAGMVEGSKISFLPNSLKMVDADGKEIAIKPDGLPVFNAEGKCSWQTTSISVLEPGDYTITYDVSISNYVDYKYNNSKKMSNTAWATYEKITMSGLPGYGPGEMPPIKVDADDFGTKMILFDKKIAHPAYEFDGYQRGAEVHGCPWIITINPDQEKLSEDFYLIETIGGKSNDPDKLEQVVMSTTDPTKVIFDLYLDSDDSDFPPGRLSQDSEEYKQIKISPVDGDPTKIKITFGNLLAEGHKVRFRFQTYLAESEREYYEGQHKRDTEVPLNGKRRYAYNTATLYDGDKEIFPKDVQMEIFTDVLRKEFVSYDYSTQIATWRLKVNHDMMSLPGAEVVDQLKMGELDHVDLIVHQLHHQSETVEQGAVRYELGTEPTNDTKGVYYTYNKSSKEVKITFGDIPMGQAYTVYVYEKIDPTATDVNAHSLANYNGEIILTNSATLNKEFTKPVTATATGTIQNSLITKQVGPSSTGAVGAAAYTITMNQGHMKWPEGAEIVDTMSAGLSVDLASVHMYVADVANDGSLSKGKEVAQSQYTVTTRNNAATAVAGGSVETIISVPKDAIDEAYIITYDVYVDENCVNVADIKFTNTVAVKGTENYGKLAEAEISLSQLMGYGSGTVSYSKVMVSKQDQDGNELPGVLFDLLYNDVVVTSVVTGQDGTFVLSNLTPGKKYILREVRPPFGYKVADDVEFTAPARGSKEFLDTPIIIVDEKIEEPPVTEEDPPVSEEEPPVSEEEPPVSEEEPPVSEEEPPVTEEEPPVTEEEPPVTEEEPPVTEEEPPVTEEEPPVTEEEPVSPSKPSGSNDGSNTGSTGDETETPDSNGGKEDSSDGESNSGLVDGSDDGSFDDQNSHPTTGDNYVLLVVSFIAMVVSAFVMLCATYSKKVRR